MAPASGPALRLAVLGAFPFPLAQGSQVFVRDQLRALAAAGTELTLFCYGTGAGEPPDGLELVRIPRALSPRPLRAGPQPAKPLADAALAAAFAAAQRRKRFELALAHNGEAALAALAARPATGVPVIYVAHTLLGLELSTYGPPALAAALNRVGRWLDRSIARAADGVIALSEGAARQLGPHARARVEVIPPGCDPAPPPAAATVARTCARFGLEPGRFAIYAGNLDRYQDLDDLEAAARRLPSVPVVAATHAPAPARRGALRVARVASFTEARALTHAAAVAVLPRRRPGGFPIKLLNYMEAERAIVAREGVAEGLEHDRSAWLIPRGAGAAPLAEAIGALVADPARAARLGRNARETLEIRHAWPELAERTLAFARSRARRRTR